MAGRRTKLEIIHDMLESVQEKQGRIKPTHLLYKSNLSHKKMTEYLDDLIQKELVQKVDQGGYQYITLTDKGTTFLFEFKRMKEFTESFGL